MLSAYFPQQKIEGFDRVKLRLHQGLCKRILWKQETALGCCCEPHNFCSLDGFWRRGSHWTSLRSRCYLMNNLLDVRVRKLTRRRVNSHIDARCTLHSCWTRARRWCGMKQMAIKQQWGWGFGKRKKEFFWGSFCAGLEFFSNTDRIKEFL